MIELAVKTGASYLLGSLIGSLIIGRVRGGVDIRQLGSGNAGGTNALRTQGRMFAFWVMLIDVGKGFVATRWIAPLSLPGLAPTLPMWREWLPALCGFAVILGHIYPLWFGFRGGKGVATLIGATAGIDAWLLGPLLAAWLGMALLSGYVGLASVAASASIPIAVWLGGREPRMPLLVFGAMICALILFTHRANMVRMRAGLEPRAQRLWILGRGR